MNLLPLLLTCSAPPAAPDFNRDVRPILANHCFQYPGVGLRK
jgi:hypothetical protein